MRPREHTGTDAESHQTTGGPRTPTRPRYGHVASEFTSSSSSADANDANATLSTSRTSCMDLTLSQTSQGQCK
ncbi:hypothetical protein VKT23_018887 [Stygiomarasmius scandens]|uniref:Uncharacterized protein n=1 Tax=Marasmiellus scandens TaxID=2682957 RepID=A0ABR1IQT8_9AGAR